MIMKESLTMAFLMVIAAIGATLQISSALPVTRVSDDNGQTFGPLFKIGNNGTINSTIIDEGLTRGINSSNGSSSRSSSELSEEIS
jgi:hypothetical protein